MKKGPIDEHEFMNTEAMAALVKAGESNGGYRCNKASFAEAMIGTSYWFHTRGDVFGKVSDVIIPQHKEYTKAAGVLAFGYEANIHFMSVAEYHDLCVYTGRQNVIIALDRRRGIFTLAQNPKSRSYCFVVGDERYITLGEYIGK